MADRHGTIIEFSRGKHIGHRVRDVIQFAPYLARKHEQERWCLARRIHHWPIDEGDIRAWVAAMIEWSARY